MSGNPDIGCRYVNVDNYYTKKHFSHPTAIGEYKIKNNPGVHGLLNVLHNHSSLFIYQGC